MIVLAPPCLIRRWTPVTGYIALGTCRHFLIDRVYVHVHVFRYQTRLYGVSDTSHLKRNAISVRLVENKRTDKLHLSQRIRYTRSPPVRSL